MYGWPLRGKCGIGSGVWHFAAMYSASLMQRFSARLDEVRGFRSDQWIAIKSLGATRGVLFSWSAGCHHPHSAPCHLGLPGPRQWSCQIILRPGNAGRFSAGPGWFGPSCWRWRSPPPSRACVQATARFSRPLHRAAAASGCAPAHRDTAAFADIGRPSSKCRRSARGHRWNAVSE